MVRFAILRKTCPLFNIHVSNVFDEIEAKTVPHFRFSKWVDSIFVKNQNSVSPSSSDWTDNEMVRIYEVLIFELKQKSVNFQHFSILPQPILMKWSSDWTSAVKKGCLNCEKSESWIKKPLVNLKFFILLHGPTFSWSQVRENLNSLALFAGLQPARIQWGMGLLSLGPELFSCNFTISVYKLGRHREAENHDEDPQGYRYRTCLVHWHYLDKFWRLDREAVEAGLQPCQARDGVGAGDDYKEPHCSDEHRVLEELSETALGCLGFLDLDKADNPWGSCYRSGDGESESAWFALLWCGFDHMGYRVPFSRWLALHCTGLNWTRLNRRWDMHSIEDIGHLMVHMMVDMIWYDLLT